MFFFPLLFFFQLFIFKLQKGYYKEQTGKITTGKLFSHGSDGVPLGWRGTMAEVAAAPVRGHDEPHARRGPPSPRQRAPRESCSRMSCKPAVPAQTQSLAF